MEHALFVKEYYEKKYEPQSNDIAYIWRIAEKEVFGDFLKDMKEKLLLEIGCGNGTTISFLVRNLGISGNDYLGIDISRNAIKQAKKMFPQGNFLTADCANLPLPSNSIDIVLCHGVLMYLLDPYKGLKEAFRVLKKGGCLLLGEPTNDVFKKGGGDSPYVGGLNVNELRLQIKNNSAQILSFVRINSPLMQPVRLFTEKINNPFLWRIKTKLDLQIDELGKGKLKIMKGVDMLIIAQKV